MIVDILNQLEELQLVEDQDPNQAVELYQNLLTETEGTDLTGMVAYAFALFLHRYGVEDSAIDLFRKSFEEGYCRDEIMALLCNDFWQPNVDELKAVYETNMHRIQSKYPFIGDYYIPFENLSYMAFPVSDERFMFFNRLDNSFLGWISIEESELVKEEPYCYLGAFAVMKTVTPEVYQAVLREGYQHKSRYIYLVPVNEEYTNIQSRCFYSLFMIPGIVEKCMNNVCFFSNEREVEQCFTNSNYYLPKSVYVEDVTFCESVNRVIRKEHERRITSIDESKPRPILTIGIPSYERGKLALNLVKTLLELPYDYEIEVVFSNNGSREWQLEYEALREIQDSRYTYFAFTENSLYHGNIAQVARLASGKWLLYLSNEDFIVEEQLSAYIEFLLEHDDVSMIRPRTVNAYKTIGNAYAPAGKKAISLLGFRDNYLSGNTYNRRFLTNECIEYLAEAFIDNVSYKVYTHSLYTIYMCVKGNVCEYPFAIVKEGEPEIISEQATKGALEFRYYNDRIEQWKGNVDFANRVDGFSDEERVYLFIVSCLKLNSLMKRYYKRDTDRDWTEVKKELFREMQQEYELLNVPDSVREQYRSLVLTNIAHTKD